MLKQLPSRNQRSKGFKVKHAVHICLLFIIGIWLLYQVKHSHAKKAGYEEISAKISEKMQRRHEILRFGRKDLHPRIEETEIALDNKGHGEEEEPEEEEEIRNEESEEEERGAGDDEIDGHDQYRDEEEEAEQGDDFDEEEDKEREEENEEQEAEGKDNELGDAGLSGDQDHDGVNRTSQEAREEHYTGDDAASAVVQNTQTKSTETENGGLRKVKGQERVENAGKNALEQGNQSNKIEEANVDINGSNLNVWEKSAKYGISMNAVENEERGNEFNLAKLAEGSQSNSSAKTQSNEQTEVNNNATAKQVENLSSSLTNGTNLSLELIQIQKVTSDGNQSDMQIMKHNENSNKSAENDQLYLNANLSTTSTDSDPQKRDSADSSGDSGYAAADRVVKYDTTAVEEDRSTSTTTLNNDHTFQSGDSNENTRVEEAEESSEAESLDIADSLYQEYREDHGLQTLQEMEIEEGDDEDAAE